MQSLACASLMKGAAPTLATSNKTTRRPVPAVPTPPVVLLRTLVFKTLGTVAMKMLDPLKMLAQVKTVFFFGLLTTIAAVAALLADLFVLPMLLRAWPPTQNNA